MSFVIPGEHNFTQDDIVRFQVFRKKDCAEVVLRKDFTVTENTTRFEIVLTGDDTKFGEIISKPVDYWYEIEVNPGIASNTIVGYDEEGARIFKLFPEGGDNIATRDEFIESAYSIAVEYGFEGSKEAWLESLKGETGATGATGATGQPGKDGKDGKDGVSIISVAQTVISTEDGGKNIVTITLSDGQKSEVEIVNGSRGERGLTGATGATGDPGERGLPGNGIASARLNADYTLTITFEDGTSYTTPSLRGETGATGATGQPGNDGKDGVSVSVKSVSENTADGGENVVTFSDGKTLKIKNGSKGSTGNAGKDGTPATHSWNGTVLTVTSASGTSSADLKGERGDRGETGKGLDIKGTYSSLSALQSAVKSPEQGDMYNVGTASPYTLYMYDTALGWVSQGQLQGAPGAVFTPSVSAAGVLSWENNGGLANPQSVNVKGEKGDSVAVKEVSESTVDGAENTVTFTDGKVLKVKNGSKGDKGDNGDDYTLTDTDKDEIAGIAAEMIDLTNYVKNDDYATDDNAGVVFTSSVAGIESKYGVLRIKSATEAVVTAKQNTYMPIVPKNLDHAVKVGITTNTKTLTDAEKATACSWLGAVSEANAGELIDTALAEAKASGEFDGEKGDKGDPGAPGNDYVLTTADKTAIAEEAAGMVDVPDVDTSALVPKSGTTMTGALVAQNNANYTTAQMRNVILLPKDSSVPATGNGDIVLFYKT